MASPTRWRAAIVGAAAGGALLIAAVLVAWQAPQGAGGWAALLEKPRGGTGWSRLPGHGVPTLWHEEPAAAAKSGGAGWGRLPEHHKPRLRRAVAGPPKRPAHLTDELPAVYHLPTDRAAGAKVPKADRLAAEKLARNLHAYHKEAMAAPREGRAGLPAGLRREEKALPPGFHVLEPGQRLPKGAKIVKAPPLPAGYHVLKPGMKLPKGAKIVEHPPQLAAVRRAPVRRRGMKVPRVGQNNHMLDEDAAEEGGEEEGGEEPCECEEGDEECECPPAPRDVPGPCECAEDDEECDCVPEPPPTPAERLEVAFESHKKSRAERITARELQAKVRRPRVLRGADVCECECIWAGASFKCGAPACFRRSLLAPVGRLVWPVFHVGQVCSSVRLCILAGTLCRCPMHVLPEPLKKREARGSGGMLAGATLGLTQRSETRLLVSVAEHGVVGTVLVCSRRKRHAARTLSASPPTLSASRPTHAHAQK